MWMKPFEVDLGYNPDSTLDTVTNSQVQNETHPNWKILNGAKFAYKLAKADQNYKIQFQV